MIIESAVGRFSVTATSNPDVVALTADDRTTLVSVCDGIELVGGAHGEDRTFSDANLGTFTLFGKTRHRVRVSRTELVRYLEYEVLNFLTYTSLNQMHALSKETPLA